ncbi:MAG: hypothetical protein M3R17_17195 [Bacteroidota bacterium]|nr:hypothetical protein [Bacteroidota bacterium]
MKKAATIFFSLFLIASFVYIVYLNTRLYYQPHFEKNGSVEINTDVLDQLHFLKRKIHAGAADEMQGVYPEGFLFMNALYGLSWCEVAGVADHNSELYKEAHDEIQFAFNEVNSEKGKSIFQQSLPVPYGVFYTGWNNYLLGKKLSVEDPQQRDTAEIALYIRQCTSIANALHTTQSPYPESYSGKSWPSDATVAVASLSFEEKIRAPLFLSDMSKWISGVKLHLDTSGLMPHSTNPFTGKTIQRTRGNSQALILNFLFDIDSSFGRAQFNIYKNKFLTTRFGLSGLREFEDEEWAEGDIDSGPVIFGIGGAASIVGLRTMVIYGDQKTAISLRNSIEAFGMASTSNGEKKYLFGQMPMADAFFAWANSKEITKDKMLSTTESWRGKFQLYSMLTGIIILFLLLWMWGKLPRFHKK